MMIRTIQVIAIFVAIAISTLSEAALPNPTPITNNDVYDSWPMVDVDSSSNLHVAYDAWDGNDGEIYYINNIGGNWNPPVQVTDNSYRDGPVQAIAVDQSGYVHITYIVRNVDFSAYYVNNVDGSWNTPERVSVQDQEGQYIINGDMDLDSQGNAHFFYMEQPFGRRGWYRNTDGRGSWSSTTIIQNPGSGVDGSPRIWVDASDNVHLASLGQTGINIWGFGVYKVFYSSGLSTPGAVTPGGPAGWLDLAVDSSGKAHIVYTLSDDPVGYWHPLCVCLEIAYVSNATGGWSSPIYLINNILVNRQPKIDVDASDNLHVTWEAKNRVDRWEVYYATKSGGSWKTTLQVADLIVRDDEEGCNAYIAVGSSPVIVFNGRYSTSGDDEIYAFTPGVADVTSTQTIPSGDPSNITFGITGVAMDFSSGSGGSVQVDRWESRPPSVTSKALPHFWDITTDMVEGTFSTTVTFEYTDAEVAAAGVDENEMVIAYYPDNSLSGWVFMSTSRDTIANRLWTTTDHLTIFAIGEGDFSLPVELSSFTASVSDGGVLLKWTTQTEVNNIGFSIYRSDEKDGSYTKIAFRPGAGNSAMPNDYQFIDKNVTVGKTYFYYLEDVDIAGNREKHDVIQITVSSRTKPKAVIPAKFALLQNYPNPFNPVTWIPYQLAQDAPVTIKIYNAKGKVVHTIAWGNQVAGTYLTKDKAAYWDGTDSLGEKVASGVYFYTLQAGEFRATRKMVIMK